MAALSKRAALDPAAPSPASERAAGIYPAAGYADSRPARAANGGPAYRRYAPLALLAAGLAVACVLGLPEYLSLGYLAESRDTLKALVAENWLISAASFLLVYILAVALSFPAASVLTVFGGFLFGWLPGTALVAVGATAGATILFLAARSAFGNSLRRRAGGSAARLAEGFEQDAFTYLLVLRLAPFIPFFIVNIAPALFDVRLKTYVGATFLGILPGVLAYSWLGQGLDSVLIAAQQGGREVRLGELVTPEITFAFAGLALVAAIAPIVKHLRAPRP